MPSLPCLTWWLLRLLHDGYLSSRVYHRVLRFFLYHCWSFLSCLAYANIVHPLSLCLHYTLSKACRPDARCLPPSSQLWSVPLATETPPSRCWFPAVLRFGQDLSLCDFSDYFVVATTALVSGLGFCIIWILDAGGCYPIPQSAAWRTRVSNFVWPIALDLSAWLNLPVVKGPPLHSSKGCLKACKLSDQRQGIDTIVA